MADTNGMDFRNERAKDALRIVLEIVHGKEVVDYENSSPRLLFYILEVHAWLGHPKATYSSGMDPKMVGTQGAQFSPFFHKDAISGCIFDMAKKAKADKRELPEEARDCIKDKDWARIQDLKLIGKSSIPIKTIKLQHVRTVDRFRLTNFIGNSFQRIYGRCALRLTESASSIYFT
ncbi:hypothetical protein FOC4_g10012783 [Fusarium odoratissimum]|uniref:Uncharacterized protein n=1 Tax=Fusarium oxysporum f. sp. cubense (strain race 4) TaxID=2502994 RepID=N1RSL5_FUSC4|nr:hypothetical protein FOC4_g10012783 [Fusarium odoratissimum]